MTMDYRFISAVVAYALALCQTDEELVQGWAFQVRRATVRAIEIEPAGRNSRYGLRGAIRSESASKLFYAHYPN